MSSFKDYFECDGCGCKEFKRVYCFGFRFQEVNFQDQLIYDRLDEEKYQCTECNKTFTMKEINQGLAGIRARRRSNFEG